MRIILSVPLTLNEIAKNALSTHILKGNATVSAIATNSKKVCPGDLFIPLMGEKHNGEDYTDEARSRGAYIISSRDCNADIKTDDTMLSLLKIASYYKSKLRSLKKIIAITGSVGKTTTKNVLAKMISSKYITHATEKNYNNYIGLSFTLLSAPANTEIIIAEMGMNHLGEISLMSKILNPDISVITNIGTSHIGNLGSRELIAEAKLEITDGMKTINLLVPYEEALLKNIAGAHTFSIDHPNADCYIQITEETSSYTLFNIQSNLINLKNLKINIPGKQVIKALSISVKVMELIGIDENDIANSVKFIDLSCLRGKIIKINDFYAYDDTYSSSAEALLCDFELLNLYKNKPKSCVLGDMLELGRHTENIHTKIGCEVYKFGFRNLYTIGPLATKIAEGAINAGMSKENVFINENPDAIDITANQILKNKIKDEIILFKASHNIHAERIIDLLLKHTDKNGERN